MNSTTGGLSSSSSLLSAFALSELGLALAKLSELALLEKKPLGAPIAVSLFADLVKPEKTDVVGLSSFTPNVNPFDFGGLLPVSEAATGGSTPPKKKPFLGCSCLSASATAGFVLKLKMFAGEDVLDVASDLVGVVPALGMVPNEKSGVVAVVVVPPLVMVQLGFLPNTNDDDDEIESVFGLPKKKPLPAEATVVEVSAAADVAVVVGGVSVAVASVSFNGVFAAFNLVSSFSRNSFAYLS